MCNTTPKTKFPFSCPVAIRPTSIKQIPSKKNSRSMRRILEEDDDDASKKRAVHSGAGGNSVWNRRTKSTSDQPKRAIALIVVNMISILAVFLNPVRQIIWRWIGCVLEVVVGCRIFSYFVSRHLGYLSYTEPLKDIMYGRSTPTWIKDQSSEEMKRQ